MRFKLRPSDDSFYDFFTRPRRRTSSWAPSCSPSWRCPGVDLQPISERLDDVEHDSDTITHELYNKINSSFITPFDREDIYRLGSCSTT